MSSKTAYNTGRRVRWRSVAAAQEMRASQGGVYFGEGTPPLGGRIPSFPTPDGKKAPELRGILAHLALLKREDRVRVLDGLSDSDKQALGVALRYDWKLWGRPARPRGDGTWSGQMAPPGDWRYWVVSAGRGYGKTRLGAEWVREKAESGLYRWITIVGPTREALRKILITGPAGVVTTSPPWFRAHYEPSKLLITWPNGCKARLYSAERPERLRGEQHEIVWMDELAAWPKPEAYEQIDMGLRIGTRPQALITTTPRPIPLIVDLVLGPKDEKTGKRVPREDVVVTKGRSEENEANLAAGVLKGMRARYGASSFGRQELDAEILETRDSALWNSDALEEQRVNGMPCTIVKTVVAVDPTRAYDPVDECGIVVCGLGEDGRGYVLADESTYGSPLTWIKRVVDTYRLYKADVIVYEENRLGKVVEDGIKSYDPKAKWIGVPATDGKHARAKPIAALYEQGKISHVGTFPHLEDEMVMFDPNDHSQQSPNRMDALVWGFTLLFLGDTKPALIVR